MNVKDKKFFHKLKLSSNNNIAIIGSSFCSCLVGDHIKSEFGSKVVFYEKTNFIGGAWRFDKLGNIFSNILAPTSIEERKIFDKIVKFLNKKNIKMKKTNFHSFYSNQIVDSYFFDFDNFYKKIKREHLFRKLKVRSISENNSHILINNKFKHDYVFFPNYVDINKISKSSTSVKSFEIPKGKHIRSKHIRIFCKNKIKDKFKYLFYSDKKFGPVDRLQIIKIKKNLFKISGRISLDSKSKSKKFLVKNLSKILNIKNIVKTYINTYKSINYNPNEIKKINMINNKFDRIKHYHTASVIGFINKYFL